MSSSSRGKSTSVGSSSFLDLKAQLARQKEEFTKARAAGVSRSVQGAVKRPQKKDPLFARPNKGVSTRHARDIELEQVNKPTLDNARAQLERKAAIYEKLRKGKTGGLTDKQFDNLLVDFDQPQSGSENDSEDSGEDEDESLKVPRPPQETEEADPVVEFEDEFGRIRTARRSEVPRNLPRPKEEAPVEPELDPFAIYGDQNHFPVYEPDADRVREIEEEYAEAIKDPTAHYDASKENRAAGAGFYQFSGDEETRRRQMEELRQMRDETEVNREASGAGAGPSSSTATLPQTDGGTNLDSTPKITGRGLDKRQRDLEERRRAIEAKRKNTAASQITPHANALSSPTVTDHALKMVPVQSEIELRDADDRKLSESVPLRLSSVADAHRERSSSGGLDKRKREIEERRNAIEAKRRKAANASGAPAPSASSAADNFLAGLEADILKRT